MSLIFTALMAFSIGFMGASSEAPVKAPTTTEVVTEKVAEKAPEKVAEKAPENWVERPLFSQKESKQWSNHLMNEAGIKMPANTKIKFTNKGNCGAEASTVSLGGCTTFKADGTRVIRISPELVWTVEGQHILIHEIAHAAGIMDECEAEAYAHQFEETKVWSYPSCELTGKP